MNAEYVYFDRLIRLRKEKEKTISDMAYESGLSASTISNYERGVRIPDGKALIKLAKYFDCTTDYLLGMSNFKNAEFAAQVIYMTDSIMSYLIRPDFAKIRALLSGYFSLAVEKLDNFSYVTCLENIIFLLFAEMNKGFKAIQDLNDALPNQEEMVKILTLCQSDLTDFCSELKRFVDDFPINILDQINRDVYQKNGIKMVAEVSVGLEEIKYHKMTMAEILELHPRDMRMDLGAGYITKDGKYVKNKTDDINAEKQE